jgi:hypothetical protein
VKARVISVFMSKESVFDSVSVIRHEEKASNSHLQEMERMPDFVSVIRHEEKGCDCVSVIRDEEKAPVSLSSGGRKGHLIISPSSCQS